jgi:hypothetical protein
MLPDESVDVAEAILLAFPRLSGPFEILREQKAAPECSVSRQGHLVPAARTGIEASLQLLAQVGPRHVRNFLISGTEICPDSGELLFLPEKGRRCPGPAVAEPDADLPDSQLIDELDRSGEVLDRARSEHAVRFQRDLRPFQDLRDDRYEEVKAPFFAGDILSQAIEAQEEGKPVLFQEIQYAVG